MDAYFAPLVATHNFSGVALIARGDRTLVLKAYGLASQELNTPNRADSKFQIASLSKLLTSAAVLRLVEQRKLDLRSPISRILPDYPNGDHLTVLQLLTHTSGIPNLNQMPAYGDLGLKRRTPAELVAAFKDAKADFLPGMSYAYSNSNYALLALIIEQVSGRSYGDSMRREVFEPLGMTATGHRGDSTEVIPLMSEGYVAAGRTGLKRPAWFDWTVKTGNGSLYSTAGDLLRFVRGYFSGQLLGGDLVKSATTSAGVPERAVGFEWMPSEMGYGWMIDQHLNRRRLYHPGTSPGYQAFLSYYPDDQLTVIVLSNTYVNNAEPAAEELAAMALGIPQTRTKISDAPVAAGTASRLVGRYGFGQDFRPPGLTLTVSEEGGHMALRFGTTAQPSPLLPLSDLNFVERTNWQTVRFDAEPGAIAHALTLTNGRQTWRAARMP